MKILRGFGLIIAPFFFFVFSFYITIEVLLKTEVTVICPEIRGKHIDEARLLLERQGLPLNIVKRERRNDVPVNYISVQRPEANIPIRKGRAVSVIISDGPELGSIPSVLGYSTEEAETVLESKDFHLGTIVTVPGPESGKVVAQNPRPGQTSIVGQKVTLYVAARLKRYYLMPDLRQENPSEVMGELDDKGIRYRAVYGRQVDGTRRIVSTSVQPGFLFTGDDEITLYAANGG